MLDKMKQYVLMTQNNTAIQERQIQQLTDELEACRSCIETLQLKVRDDHKGVSQFSLEKLKSGGTRMERRKHQVEKGLNGIFKNTDGVHIMDPVLDEISDPCPTPEFVDSLGGAKLIAEVLKRCARFGRVYTKWNKKEPEKSVKYGSNDENTFGSQCAHP